MIRRKKVSGIVYPTVFEYFIKVILFGLNMYRNDDSWTFSLTDNTVSVPIVPLTEENETAMEDEMFLSFLRNIGITSPANEQVEILL